MKIAEILARLFLADEFGKPLRAQRSLRRHPPRGAPA